MIERLIEALGADAVKTEPEDLAVYSFDAYTEGRPPRAVRVPLGCRQASACMNSTWLIGCENMPKSWLNAACCASSLTVAVQSTSVITS